MLADPGPDPSYAYVSFVIKVLRQIQFRFCFDVQMRSFDGYIMGKEYHPPSHTRWFKQIYFTISLIISFCVHVSSHPGVVRQLNPIPGPRSIDLDVEIQYMKYGLMTHSSEVFIHVIVSEFSF